jgi:hypothetical protein
LRLSLAEPGFVGFQGTALTQKPQMTQTRAENHYDGEGLGRRGDRWSRRPSPSQSQLFSARVCAI